LLNKKVTLIRNRIKQKKYLFFLLLIFALGFFLFYFKSLFVAATVNNAPITRWELIKELEKQGGEQVLGRLVAKSLILQEAKRKKVEITKEQIDEEIETIKNSLENQGVSFEDALASQGQTEKDLRESILMRKIVETILGPDIKVEDEEIEKYFEENKSFLGEEADLKSNREQIKNVLFQQKLTKKYQAWIGGLQKEAKIKYFVSF
jgi:parvulin-like peptidyl-prolyl isomerase